MSGQQFSIDRNHRDGKPYALLRETGQFTDVTGLTPADVLALDAVVHQLANQIRATGADLYNVDDAVWYHPANGAIQPGTVTGLNDQTDGAQSLYIETPVHRMLATNTRSLTRRVQCTFQNANGPCTRSASPGSPTKSCEVHEV